MTGAELAAIRKAAGLSQTELAQRVGIGRHAVSYWENKPEVDAWAHAVKRIAEVLDLSEIMEKAEAQRRAWWADWDARIEAEDRAREAAMLSTIAAAHRRAAERARKRRVRCGAKTRKGTPCRMKSEPGKRRCKFHGGKSTGARTPEGLERIREAQKRRWAHWREAKLGTSENLNDHN